MGHPIVSSRSILLTQARMIYAPADGSLMEHAE